MVMNVGCTRFPCEFDTMESQQTWASNRGCSLALAGGCSWSLRWGRTCALLSIPVDARQPQDARLTALSCTARQVQTPFITMAFRAWYTQNRSLSISGEEAFKALMQLQSFPGQHALHRESYWSGQQPHTHTMSSSKSELNGGFSFSSSPSSSSLTTRRSLPFTVILHHCLFDQRG